MISSLESGLGVAAGAVGLGSLVLFLVGRRSFGFWETVCFLRAILAAALAAAIGAHRHVARREPSGLWLLWLATGLALVVAAWSALSPVLILLAVLALAAALLGTGAGVRAR
jgi:hypothetical protein